MENPLRLLGLGAHSVAMEYARELEEQKASAEDSAAHWQQRCEDLERDNAELRRYCRDLRLMADTSACSMCGEPCQMGEFLEPYCELDNSLRDLGVEVPQ